ncbi:translation initiation factor eIF2B subunit alpha [Diutina catenulata]
MTEFDIKATYLDFLQKDPDMTMPIAAIESLVTMLRAKQPQTSSELINLVRSNIAQLKSSISNSISLGAGCDLFMRFVLRNTNLYSDWDSCRSNLVENGALFVQRAKESRAKLAQFGVRFINDDDIVLVHSYSRAVHALLVNAKQQRVRFRVIVTEARPSGEGYKMAKLLQQEGIPVEVIVDAAVGYVIHNVDKIFVGAEGVAESGGIINHIGSYQVGCLAKINHKPFYVAAESHKFVRMFPNAPNDLPQSMQGGATDGEDMLTSYTTDYTPDEFITALVTDLGVLTPSAVSEELIKVWYD